MKKITPGKAILILIIAIVGCFGLVVILLTILNGSVSDDKLKSIATTYAKAKCKAGEKDNKFCDNLYVSSIFHGENTAKVWWTVYIQRSDTGELYSSLIINSNGDNPKVAEDTYTLAQPSTTTQPTAK
jgi:hypothetical protein